MNAECRCNSVQPDNRPLFGHAARTMKIVLNFFGPIRDSRLARSERLEFGVDETLQRLLSESLDKCHLLHYALSPSTTMLVLQGPTLV